MKEFIKNKHDILIMKSCLTCQFKSVAKNGTMSCVALEKNVSKYECCDGYMISEKYQNAGKGDGVVTPKSEIIKKQQMREEMHNALLYEQKKIQNNIKEEE